MEEVLSGAWLDDPLEQHLTLVLEAVAIRRDESVAEIRQAVVGTLARLRGTGVSLIP
jgi:hypothetical protein